MKLSMSYKSRMESSPDFSLFKNTLFPKVMKWEGGAKLHQISGDGGGWTKYGIAYNFWKHLFEDFEDFKDTSLEEAVYFAYDKFYSVIRADLVPHEVKLYYFDTAYNLGTSRTIKLMQKCVGVKADGIIGPITKLHMYDLKEECLRLEREKHYKSLVGRFGRLKKFYQGWMNRSSSVFNYFY